jgi:hypothetical protein
MINLRVEKSNKNHDDFRVLMAGCVIALLLLVGTPMIYKWFDNLFSDKPFVTAILEVVEKNGKLYVLYDADATREVDGSWIASIVETETNTQIITRKGEGSYNANIDEPRLWSWEAFFDNEKGLNEPGVPNVPFQVCVRYVVTSRTTQITDESPIYCSPTFNPTME